MTSLVFVDYGQYIKKEVYAYNCIELEAKELGKDDGLGFSIFSFLAFYPQPLPELFPFEYAEEKRKGSY